MNLFDLPELPSSVMGERLVIGAMLVQGHRFPEVRDTLSADDFTLEKHKAIWQTFDAIYRTGSTIDRYTVAMHLKNAGKLESVDGLTYLSELDGGTPEIYGLEAYCRELHEKTVRRNLIYAAREIATLAAVGTDGSSALLEQARNITIKAAGQMPSCGLQSPLEIVDAAGGIESYLDQSALPGCPYPIKALTESTGGMRPGDLVILAARTGRGKTAFALWAAAHAAKNGFPTALFSMEMSKQQLLNRLIGAEGQFNTRILRQPKHAHVSMDGARAAAQTVQGLPVYVDDSTGLTVAKIVGAVQRERAKREIKFIIVDYLQLLIGEGRTRTEQVGSVARGLKNAAMELGVPIFALSQFSRPPKPVPNGKAPPPPTEPTLEDLKESSEIEQAANAVLILHGSTSYDSVPVELLDLKLIIAKMRDGASGYSIPIVFQTTCGRFHEAA